MWSATWPKEVHGIARDYMQEFIQVVVGSEDLKSSKHVKQAFAFCSGHEKYGALMNQMRSIKVGDRVLIFTETKRMVDDLQYRFRQDGIFAGATHGDKTQRDRERAIQEFKSGRTPVLIATDVASRGLDVKELKWVINYDCPKNAADYIHRVGRTGRKTKDGYNEGNSLTLFTPDNAGIARGLVDVLTTAEQPVPDELRAYARSGGSGGGRNRYGRGRGRGGGRGGGRFGGGYRR